ADEQIIPASAVLIEEQDRLSHRAYPRLGTRCLNLHQSNQTVHLRLIRRKLSQNAAEAQRALAELRTHPVITSGRGVALIKDEIDDLEHRRQTGGKVSAARDFKRNALFGKRAFGPHDALRDRRFRDEEGTRDLFGGESSQEPERECCASFGGEHRMTGYENKP